MSELLEFFDRFEAEHNKSRANVADIGVICDALTTVIDTYSADNYCDGKSPTQAKNDANAFVLGFYPIRLNATGLVNSAQNSIDNLLEMASCFTYERKLTCKAARTLTGCEAEQNQLQCDILAFFKGLPAAGKQASDDLSGLLDSCYGLNALVREYSNDNHLLCESNGTGCQRSANRLCSNTQYFFEYVFGPPHADAHEYLVDIQGLCDNVYGLINEWQARLISLTA